MKNHDKKRSEKQPLEDGKRELNLKYHDVTLDTAKASSERSSPSLHRRTKSLPLGVLALIVSIGIGIIPSLHLTFSPATAFAQPEPQGVCVGCGRKIGTGHTKECIYNPDRYKGTPTGTKALSASQLGGLMFMQGLIGGLFADLAPGLGSAKQQAEAAKRAQLQAWMAQEQQRLTAIVAKQRVERDEENKTSMEEIRTAIGSGVDTRMPKPDLATALSDPNVVDLRGHPADKPLVVGNLKQDESPGGTPFFGSSGGSASKAPSTAKTTDLQAQYAKKILQMVKENRDPKKLYQRQLSLENELKAVLQQAKEIQSKSEANVKDYDEYEKWVASVSGKTKLEGIGLASTQVASLLWDLYNEKKILKPGREFVVDQLTDLQKINPKAWEETWKAMDVISKGGSIGLDTYNYGKSEKELLGALDLIGKHLPEINNAPYGMWWKVGRSLVESGIKIGNEIEIMGNIRERDGTTQAYRGKQQWIDNRIKSLVKAIKENREQWAKEMGVSPDSLKRPQEPQEPPHKGLGSKVPPLS